MSQKLYKTALLLGAPGTGKGTQGNILGAIPGFYHCSCGDVFRRLNPKSELGRIFYEYSTRGELVPDDVTVRMWSESIHAHEILGEYRPDSDLLVLDGIPRTNDQAQLLESSIEVLKIIHLTCTNQEAMIDRLRRRALKENRLDDADEKVIRHRWEVYQAETAPVLNHYDKSLVAEVDAIGTPAEVFTSVLSILAPIQHEHFARFEG